MKSYQLRTFRGLARMADLCLKRQKQTYSNKGRVSKKLKLFFIPIFLCCFYLTGFSQEWEALGPNDFNVPILGTSTDASTAADGNENVYVAYKDAVNGDRLTVRMYDGNNWQTVGVAGFSANSVSSVSLAIDGNNIPYVAYKDGANNKVTVIKLDGGSWQTVGVAGFSASTVADVSLAINDNNIPYVAYGDHANGSKATVKEFDGSNWIDVGTAGFSSGGASLISLAFDSNHLPYVIFGAWNVLTVMRYDGVNWTTVGNTFVVSGNTRDTKIVIDKSTNTPYAYYVQGSYSSPTPRLLKYDGSSWGIISVPSKTSDIAMDDNNDLYRAFSDAANSNKATVEKYDGTNWTTVGSAGFSSGSASPKLIVGNNNVLYANYGAIQKYDGSNWITLGDSEDITGGLGGSTISLAIDNNNVPYISYVKFRNSSGGSYFFYDAYVKKFDGINWVQIGSFYPSRKVELATDSNNDLYMVYRDDSRYWDNYSDGRGSARKYDGTTWTQIGTGFTGGAMTGGHSIAIDNNDTLYLAFGSSKASVMKYDGSSWSYVGNFGFSAGNAYDISMAIDGNNVPYVVYRDLGNSSKATVMKYDGTNWVTVGAAGFSAGRADYTSIAIDGNNVPYVVYHDDSDSSKATVKKFDGTNWVNVGNAGFSPSNANYTKIVIDNNNIPHVAYVNADDEELVVVKFDGTNWVNVGSDDISADETYQSTMTLDANGDLAVAYNHNNPFDIYAKTFTGTSSPDTAIAILSFDEIIKAVASDRDTSDSFGYSVAISENYAIVGSPNKDDINGGTTASSAGAAYIFEKDANGTWNEIQKIVASDRTADDQFGIDVAISGDYIIVGAVGQDKDENGLVDADGAGAAYIFERGSNGTWTQSQKIVSSDRNASDAFGGSVSISFNHAIVGAENNTSDANGIGNTSGTGAAYIFERDINGLWTQNQKIVAPDRADNDLFGYDVAISENFAVISAYEEDEDENGTAFENNAGSAYIFEKVVNGPWTINQKIVASDRNDYDYFGSSVAISENYIIVGAALEDEDANGAANKTNSGSAYIFEHDGNGTWTEIQKIAASDRGDENLFGNSVSITDNYAIVGAFQSNNKAGTAYVFENDGSGLWTESRKLVAPDSASNDNFGVSVAISDNDALVGAYNEDEDVNGTSTMNSAGSAYFFGGSSDSVTTFDVDFAAPTICPDATGWLVPITVGTVPADIGAITLTVDYDNTKMIYDTYTAHANLDTANTPVIIADNNGKITISWISTSGATISNETLMSLKFVPAGGASDFSAIAGQTTDFTWDQSAANNCEIADNLINVLNGVFNDQTGASINSAPVAELSASDTTICIGDNVTFTATGGVTYEFSLTRGGVTTTAQASSASATYVTDTLQAADSVTVTVTDANGCSATAGLMMIVSPLPVADLSASDTTICAGDNVTFTATPIAGSATYEFFVDGNSQGTASATNTFSTNAITNTQVVTVTVTNENGCVATSIGLPMIVNPSPTVTLSSDDADNIICAGDSITFTGSGTGVISYTFNVNGGTSVAGTGANNDEYTVNTLNDGDMVIVTGTNANGCSSTDTIQITVSPAPTAGLTANDTTICVGDVMIFTATGGVSYEYLLDNGSGYNSIQDSTLNTFATSSINNGNQVKVIVTNVNGCVAESAEITVTVTPLPTTTLASDDSDARICQGQAVAFTASSSDGADEFIFVSSIDGNVQGQSSTATYTDNVLQDGEIISVIGVNSSTGCQQVSDSTIIFDVDNCSSISGTLRYKNAAETPMGNVGITIKGPGIAEEGKTIVTGATNGVFTIPDLFDNETYTFSYTTTKSHGGINSTDALASLLDVVGIANLAGLNAKVANVNLDSLVTSADALSIQLRFVFSNIDSFPNGQDWAFGVDAITVTGNMTNQQWYALAMGDVNGSYTPIIIENGTPTVSMINDGQLVVNDGDRVQIPVRIKNGADVGAMSLSMFFPSNAMTIHDVTLANGNSLLYNVAGNELRMAWADINSTIFADDDVLYYIDATINDVVTYNNAPMGVNMESELANGTGAVIDAVTLGVPTITGTVTSTNQIETAAANVRSFPNPFSDRITIEYDLPSTSNVTISIFNALGQEITTLVNDTQSEGTHRTIWNAENQAAGIYFYTITLTEGSNSYKETKQVVLIK